MNHNAPYNPNRVSLSAKAQGAFLGAAVGDALGWPQELPYKRVDPQKDANLNRGFQRWVRKSGGQYYPHEEVILPGEYSDDTQLLLSTARSLLYGKQWWHHLTRRELTTWTRYERGGGGATKRSAQEWLTGLEPWLSSKNKKRYFEAGGNGVAMRILPHCLLGVKDTNFGTVAQNIVANGISTHGHPRALVGALAYGFAVWVAFQETETLKYGAILEKVLTEVNAWSGLPDLGNFCGDWQQVAQQVNAGAYDQHWQETVDEMKQLLEQCLEGMKPGSLPIESEVLTKLGCFDKSIKGAGTVTAAASIFLASRYAADPFNGLIEAAFAQGADTDTLASMTGGLLGAVAGTEWLEDYTEQVQDSTYIRQLAENLVKNPSICQIKRANDYKVKRESINSFIEKLETLKQDNAVWIPDGRQGKLSEVQIHQPRSKTTRAISWKLITDESQSLYIKKISRQKADAKPKPDKTISASNDRWQPIALQPSEARKIAVRIEVSDLAKARSFYEKALGLKVEKEKENLVNYGSIALVLSNSAPMSVQQTNGLFANTRHTICIEYPTIDPVYHNVCQLGFTILKQISEKGGRQFFQCLDPEENTVEVIEEQF